MNAHKGSMDEYGDAVANALKELIGLTDTDNETDEEELDKRIFDKLKEKGW